VGVYEPEDMRCRFEGGPLEMGVEGPVEEFAEEFLAVERCMNWIKV
jgi:hypothetical protein